MNAFARWHAIYYVIRDIVVIEVGDKFHWIATFKQENISEMHSYPEICSVEKVI